MMKDNFGHTVSLLSMPVIFGTILQVALTLLVLQGLMRLLFNWKITNFYDIYRYFFYY